MSPEHRELSGDGAQAPCACEACRQRAREQLPPADLSARVLGACEDDLALLRRRARLRPRLALAGLAAVALFTLTLHVSLLPREVRPGAPGPAHWLASSLRADGRFDANRLEVPRADEVGLHALALLALATAPEGAGRDSGTSVAALSAARWLLDQQADDGSIGAPVGAGFDHALGTVALLEAGVLTGDAAVLAGAERAVALIAARQAQDGGWQPRVPGRPGSTPAQTAWTLAALLRAQQLGVTDLQGAIARGQSRLAADLGPDFAATLALDGMSRDHAATPGDLDLVAVRSMALGASRPRAPAPAGGLYAASLALLTTQAMSR